MEEPPLRPCGDHYCFGSHHANAADDGPPLLLPETIAIIREQWDGDRGAVIDRWITIALCPKHVLTLEEFRRYVEAPNHGGRNYRVFIAQGFTPPTA
jgi:hypothetical protein